MQWFNIFLPKLGAEPFTKATDEEMGCWLRLMRYSVIQETKGILKGAGAWTDREWLVTIGNNGPVKTESKLWHYEESDLHIVDYPTWHERRRDSRAAAKLRLQKHRELKRQRNGSGNAHETLGVSPVLREQQAIIGNAGETPAKRQVQRA